ncbi:MAG: UDPGP type 1 family protein [Lachnospiraceae bacterium]|nr:UDPGP type 1 family protein [Lachnospiraceae bacterium]
MNFNEAKKLLEERKQAQVLEGFANLSKEEQDTLLDQIEKIDWDTIDLVQGETIVKPSIGKIEPLAAVDIKEIEARKEEFDKAGLEALSQGKVAALLLAGGMGTRLGSDKPKGELNVGLTKEIYIFQRHIECLQKVSELCGKTVPLYIMTSEKNDEETQRFFKEKNYFGYPEEDVKFFQQEMAVAVDYNGKILREEPGRLATSPNGNGGWFSSLANAGLVSDMKKRGVEWINLFAVDNVLQKICDPAFVGATLLSGKESGSKVVRKVDAHEKMGVLCKEDGKPSIVEYYEMSDEMAEARNADGELTYAFGVILNYLFKVEKLEEIVATKLPVHVVEKKIPYINDKFEVVKPEEPNGYKFEYLVVDMIRLLDDTLPYEVVRESEFAPIKNLHGVDSLDSARELLQKNGVEL